MDKLKMHTPNFTAENIEKLAELFPNCVTETKDEKTGELKRAIDFDQLRQEISDHIVDGPRERYHLDWPGKREALLTANAPIAKTLRPFRKESVDFDTTKNLFIEGDNLDALKLLQETYLGKVKLIYIDPPYNTGGDHIYEDNFAQNAESYLLQSNQKDERGAHLVANPESNGRFHSDWLSMIYPRLKLAKNLLHEDGAIFVSIGIEELATLRQCMTEIFGEGNFVEVFSWVKTSTPPALSYKSRKTIEYIVCFERCKNNFRYFGDLLDGGDQPLLNRGNNEAVLTFPREMVRFNPKKFPDGPLQAHRSDRVELLNDVILTDGYADRSFRMKGEFKWSQEFFDKEVQNGTRFIIKSEQLSVRFLREEEGSKRPTNLIKQESLLKVIDKPAAGVDTNENASAALKELLGGDYFDHPKPVSLIAYLCRFLTSGSDIVMDFFAGSGTTAHAVMELNRVDGGHRQWILVQYPEELDIKNRSDIASKKRIADAIAFLHALGLPPNIAEIAKERIRRAGEKMGADSDSTRLDRGFRVLKVDTSNLKDVYYTPDALTQGRLELHADNIKEDRSSEDLLFQVLVDWGVDLSLPIEQRTIDGKSVFFVDGNALAACFDPGVDEDLVKEMAKNRPLRALFQDGSFAGDSTKINVNQIFKLLSPETEVRSL